MLINYVLCALFYRICDPLCRLDSEQVHLSSVSGILPWISQCLCLQCTHSELINLVINCKFECLAKKSEREWMNF